MAENTTDRRVRKTRGQLRQGLVRLMREKSIQDITVKELCEECDINRGTFYLHYTDVYQLLHSIEDELLVEFERVLDGLTAQSVLAAATPSPAMCSMFELLADNADMCLVLLCHNGDMAFLEKVKDIVRLRVLDEWGAQFRSNGGTPMIMYIPSSYPAASACCSAGWRKRCPSPRGRWQPWWRACW